MQAEGSVHEAAPIDGVAVNLDWYRSLTGRARHAFWAGFIGWALDAFDFQILSFALPAIAAAFALNAGQSGLIATVTLVVSALGGVLAGVLADAIGRVRTLMLTIAVFSVFTFLAGLAQSFEQLLVTRAVMGLGFGGEWAAGAILIAEIADPRMRGRVLGAIQSAWAIGWGLALIASTWALSAFAADTGWRVLFWLGILPALLILYVRRSVQEPAVYLDTKRALAAGTVTAQGSPLAQIFKPDLIRTTFLASLLATGCQGGYYAIFTWLPTFLRSERGMSVVGSFWYIGIVIIGSFVGYMTGGYLNDHLGRRKTFALYAVASAVVLILYTQVPAGQNELMLLLGALLGFTATGIFSGFGSFLAELYPSRARGAGQGFCYNVGRAVGAIFPTVIGFLSASIGFAGAIAFGALGYALVLIALAFLPETRGKTLVAVD